MRACPSRSRPNRPAWVRRALPWDALVLALAVGTLVPGFTATPAAQLLARPMSSSGTRGWVWGDVEASYVQETPAAGLEGASLRVSARGRSRDIALDGTLTGRRARSISTALFLAPYNRILLHLDREQDASGLLVVDLGADSVVDAVIGRDFTPSPDARFWVFEEHASRTTSQWPHTETVYAVYDAGAPADANARACPTNDERCRGQVLYLPDRLTRCHAIAKVRGGSCLTPGRQPGHARRSPFVWLSANEVAWIDVDLERQIATLVVASMTGGIPPQVRAVPLESDSTVDHVEVPPVREAWTIDRITRDDDPSRLWLHFRTRVAQAPTQRLGVRLY